MSVCYSVIGQWVIPENYSNQASLWPASCWRHQRSHPGEWHLTLRWILLSEHVKCIDESVIVQPLQRWQKHETIREYLHSSLVAYLLGRSVGQWSLGQMSFPLVDMTWGHWPWSRVTIKNLEIKVAFLLGKSVHEPFNDSFLNIKKRMATNSQLNSFRTRPDFQLLFYILSCPVQFFLPFLFPAPLLILLV